MRTEEIKVLDAEPGRIRLRVPGLWDDPALARDIQRALDDYPGINSARLGLLDENVTVKFAPPRAAAVLERLDLIFPGAGFDTMEMADILPYDDPAGRPRRLTRDAARARASAKRRGLATVGFTLAGVLAGVIVNKFIKRK